MISADLVRALAARVDLAADLELRPRDKIYVSFDLSGADRERILTPGFDRDLELQATPENPEQEVSIDGRIKACPDTIRWSPRCTSAI